MHKYTSNTTRHEVCQRLTCNCVFTQDKDSSKKEEDGIFFSNNDNVYFYIITVIKSCLFPSVYKIMYSYPMVRVSIHKVCDVNNSIVLSSVCHSES